MGKAEERISARILIVDDDPAICALLQQILARDDFELVLAGSAEEALAKVADLESLEVALVDKNLPDGSGLDVCAQLRERVPQPEIVLMTAYASLDSAVQAMHIGAFDYMRKPFDDLDKIRLVIQNALDKCNMGREQSRLISQLIESNERFTTAARGANGGLWDWDLKSNEIFFSERWKAMLGYRPDELSNDPDEWFSRIIPNDRKRVRTDLDTHLAGHTAHFETEYRILHRDGTYRWFLSRGMVVSSESGTPGRIAGSCTDVTLRKRAEEDLRHAALHDELTGLPNRALFRDRVQRLIERGKRHPEFKFAVLYLDLDRFKLVNDSLGHPFGDELLVATARRLERCVRSSDTVARVAGDHFSILLDGIDGEQDAILAAQRILDELKTPFELGGQDVFTNASIGVAVAGRDYALPEDVERDADIAMYRAKGGGGGRYEIFDQEMHERAVELLYLHTSLHRAVERGDFALHYQPLVDLKTGRLIGFEALLRWHHPERGIVSPVEFIPIAEETGLIIEIGQWVLQQACTQLKRWAEGFPDIPITLGVNLSGRQLRHAGLVDDVRSLISDTGLESNRLHLELTESVIMENTEIATRLLEGLKALDIELHLDDFGTGFSSLSYLHRFPFDFLKIDRAFVRAIENGKHRNIVQSIIRLAESLGIGVVAEGVETVQQLAELRRLGCTYGQGYLFARPMDAEAADAWLRAYRDRGQRAELPAASNPTPRTS